MWPIIKCSSQIGVGPVMDAWPHLVCGVLGGWLVKDWSASKDHLLQLVVVIVRFLRSKTTWFQFVDHYLDRSDFWTGWYLAWIWFLTIFGGYFYSFRRLTTGTQIKKAGKVLESLEKPLRSKAVRDAKWRHSTPGFWRDAIDVAHPAFAQPYGWGKLSSADPGPRYL